LLEAFLVSTGVVALAEIGDKSQLLALVLAAKFRKPVPIAAGILVATLLTHSIAGVLGVWIASVLGPSGLKWVLGLSFIGMAVWVLIPEKGEDKESIPPRYGAFVTTVIVFFLAEMGDKTQFATIALAAKYPAFPSLVAVVVGATLGELLANVPAIWLGAVAANKLPLKLIHGAAAGIFLILGLFVLFGTKISLAA
jgi:Ca2+/H+ antiporter, TMEM165/GDT1 family